ncbi:MAG: CotH kinase family protein [Alloprevotella sp.]
MKRTLLFLFGLLLWQGTKAEVKFESGKKYAFVCDYKVGGAVALGANHGSTAVVYHVEGTIPSDGYWYITEDAGGYAIQNTVSGQYLYYDPVRVENSVKGLNLRDAVEDDLARWTFSPKAGTTSFYIQNLKETEQWWNLRTDGTNLMGTYASHDGTSLNEIFKIYDEDGNQIVDDSAETGGSEEGGEDGKEDTGSTLPIEGNSGITEGGLYWERTGLAQPFVYTTNTANPVLYTIRNVRSNLDVYDYEGYLYQGEADQTKFYFVENNGSTAIYTAAGSYVSTYQSSYSSIPVQTYSGITTEELWSIGFYADPQYPGYYLKRNPQNSWGNGNNSDKQYWNDFSNSYIGYWSCDEGSTFVFCSDDERHISYLQEQGISFSGTQPTGFKAYISSLRVNEKDLIYDKLSGAYFFSLPDSVHQSGTAQLQIDFQPSQTDGAYTLSIGGQSVGTNQSLTLSDVTCLEPYEMAIIKDGTETVATASLHFTYLPIVEVNYPACNGNAYTTGSLRVFDPDVAGYDSTVIAAFKYRGATAQGYAKKSYAIKLRDADGNSVDREYFALRNDNNWILDAMAVDKACMRNRVSTDLWNDFAKKPYQRRQGWEAKAKGGTRGRFVEVFLNGNYHGLYCMTEKMDRKQLRLKKSEPATDTTEEIVHGTLYKSSQWSYEVLMGHEMNSQYYPKTAPSSYNNDSRSETWCSYEIKYPDYEEEKIDWGPLWNAVNFVATSGDNQFDAQLQTYFDLDNVTDYYLFIELLLATDNHGKNMFFYNYDQLNDNTDYRQMIGLAPWDLDGTWGRRWDGSSSITSADQDFDTFLWSYEHGNLTLFTRMLDSYSLRWNDLLSERYAKLRGKEFQEEALIKRFTDYADLFSQSGADLREQSKWPTLHASIATDVAYISEWIHNRLTYLDEQYSYTAPIVPDGIEQVADSYVGVSGGTGCVHLNLSAPQTVKVYTAGGQLVRTVNAGQGHSSISGLTPGVYIVCGQKAIVR